MKQKLGKERGITLVALIITIIVLIILAAVTINAAFKSNFIEMATNGTANYANAQSYEQRMMDDLSDKLDGVINKISDIQSASSAERELDKFTKNPDAYKHPDQSEENKDRGVGTDGKPVNMDLWRYEIKDETKKEIYLSLKSSGESGYIGEYINGEIQGTVPQYIKIDGREGIYTVTDMWETFGYCDKLVEAPKIPSSVIFMNWTFRECTSLVKAPEIPSVVTEMTSTFYGCSSLTKAPKLPSGVIYIDSTFEGCSSLTEVSDIPDGVKDVAYTFRECTSLVEAPEIPSSVMNMMATFDGCTSLEIAPEIPNSVTNMWTTFASCTSLKGNIKINSENVTDVSSWSFSNPITIQVPAGSTTYELINQKYGSDPNITIETF